jgi:hypothetical protein
MAPAAPQASHSVPRVSVGAAPGRERDGSVRGSALPASRPTHLTIPAIGVDHAVRPTGLNPDGTLHTPPLSQVAWPVWYEHSPTPGQRGPAVIAGHIDSAKQGQGVFFRLGALSKGDRIAVARADGSTAHFVVYALGEYSKSAFPTGKVYGNTPDAELRLISCGGSFNAAKHSYRDNIVVYAHLAGGTGQHHAA